jgi:hypothetical protein
MRRYADVQWYNDTWSSWAFPLTAEPAKINQLMAYLCSETHGSGMFRYFADWATDTHTHTDTVGIHTNTHPKKHKTGINNDQQWSTFTTTCYSCSLYLLVSPRTLYGRSVWIGLSWSLKANCAEQSLPLLTLLPLSTSTILSQVESISSWTLGILLCQRTMAFWIAYLQKWSKMQILWNGNCRESTVEKAIESAILRSSWNNFLSHSSLSPRESTN